MIQITSITQLSKPDFDSLNLPTELNKLITLKHEVTNLKRFTRSEEALFLLQKEGQIIGYGSVECSPDVPLTAGIAYINDCFIISAERNKGYGNQLFRHLKAFAQLHFGLLQLNDACPMQQRMGSLIDL